MFSNVEKDVKFCETSSLLSHYLQSNQLSLHIYHQSSEKMSLIAYLDNEGTDLHVLSFNKEKLILHNTSSLESKQEGPWSLTCE